MADENEITKLRKELKQIQDGSRKSRRRFAVGFLFLVILVFALGIALVYARVYQDAATNNAYEAIRQQQLAVRDAGEARRQEAVAQEQRKTAEEAYKSAKEELAKCKGKK